MKIQRVVSIFTFLAIAILGISCSSSKDSTDDGGTTQKKDTTTTPVSTVTIATSDNWTATDEQGRIMPLEGEVTAKNKKYVAMFYWTWHCRDLGNYPFNVNISEVIRDHPEALQDYNSKYWGQEYQPCFWGKPLFGYYSTEDSWVLRKHAEMLADAGVDVVFFDCTNGDYTWDNSYNVLLATWEQAKKDGVNVPKIAFLLAFGATDGSLSALRKLYADIYQPGRYSDLWFNWEGKPLIMAYNNNLTSSSTDQAIKAFFTFRPGQGDYVNGPSGSQWGWLEVYPQHTFNSEQVCVGVAQNATAANGGHCYAFNAPGSYGRSYTYASGQDQSDKAYLKGLNFQEQWDRALTLKPKLVFVTGWNEWTAGKQPNWPPDNPYKPMAFPDEYDSERSRDIEPNAEWGDNGDNYYYQLVQNVRKFKGVTAMPVVSAAKTISLNDFSGWTNVTPDFKHYRGNTLTRNHVGQCLSGEIYTNNTGRNDIVDAKVARDNDYVYFYVQTDQQMTPSSDKAWMRLFINIDRSAKTGWKGYDYLINYKNPSNGTGTVSKCSGTSWQWEDAGTFTYIVDGNQMALKVPKSVLGVTGKLNMEFKWSDNMQNEGNILDFYVNGDVAPGGRFNFVYKE